MRVKDITMQIGTEYKMHTPEGVKNVGLALEVIKDYHDPGAGQFVQAIYTRLHSGCHIDAPAHMVEGGKNIIDYPVSRFVGPAVMADMRHKSPGKPITDEDLEAAVGELIRTDPRLKDDCRLIINTGWNANYGKEDYETNSPYLTLEALQWCIDMKLKVVGMDFAHIRDDERATKRYITSRTLLENDVLTLSRIYNLDQIEDKVFILSCLPLNIRDTEASMTRVVVIEGLL